MLNMDSSKSIEDLRGGSAEETVDPSSAFIKSAAIFGITGQDGSYLADFLLSKNYIVHGMLRRCSHVPTERIEHILNHPRLHLHYCDLADPQNIYEVLLKINQSDKKPPDEIYNLAAQSHVQVSFAMPLYTAQVDALGQLSLLNAIKELQWIKQVKIYNAATSELFGNSPPPQNESTPFHPRSPYAVAKIYAYWITVNYREAYHMFAVNGILFNHESPRRNVSFVTRKITRAVGQIVRGELDCLRLGNLNAKRDWGHSKDYVRAMWLMLQQPTPMDLVLGTGKSHTVREFVTKAFLYAGVEVEFQNAGIDEVGIDKRTGNVLVRIDPQYFRPSEVENLQSDPALARTQLQWVPEHSFEDLVKEMVQHDLNPSHHKY